MNISYVNRKYLTIVGKVSVGGFPTRRFEYKPSRIKIVGKFLYTPDKILRVYL